ncbi:F-box only protein 5 [Lepisosteus oculatus]|uniref:F-box only protein 5 n=1 Tax=Lepisosteus oculatus TaxID=7918 RepID=UPI0035F519B9
MKCPFAPLQKPSPVRSAEKDDGRHGTADFCREKRPLKEEPPVCFDPQRPGGPGASPVLLREPLRGVHNKENRRTSLAVELSESRDFDSDCILSGNVSQEDSGYLSLHSSQTEQGELGLGAADDDQKVPRRHHQHTGCSPSVTASPCGASPVALGLPVLHFQQTVCKELRRRYRRTQKFDWGVVGEVAEDFRLQGVVGRKMGVEQLDIFEELLERDMRHVLAKILRFLTDVDLINCQKVSKTWRRVICEDKWAFQMCKTDKKDAETSGDFTTRDFAFSREVLSCLQVAASTPVHKPPRRKECGPSRHTEFQQAADALKQHEALKPCSHCGSPAKFDSYLRRATCTRASCGFDFCTSCLCAYHGSQSCRTGKRGQAREKTTLLPGSSRSKKNLKRL